MRGRSDPRDVILASEAELLQIAYANMARLYFDHIDVLIVEEIGKNISGAGMDPNIIGRTAGGVLPGYSGPTIRRIVVDALTTAGYGNAIGIGEADFTTERLAAQLDRTATYANAIAAGVPESARLPIVLPTLDDAVRAACQTSGIDDWSQAAIVRIKNRCISTRSGYRTPWLQRSRRIHTWRGRQASDTMLDIFLSIAPIFLLLVLGYVLRRGGIPSVEFWNLNDRLVYWILFPALLFSNTSTINLSGDLLSPFAVAIYCGFGSAVIFALVSSRLFRLNGPTASVGPAGHGRATIRSSRWPWRSGSLASTGWRWRRWSPRSSSR